MTEPVQLVQQVSGVPWAIAGTAGSGLVAAIVALWHRISTVEKRERQDCAERVEKLEHRVEGLEKRHEDCEERWRREVRRGAELYAIASQEPAKPAPVAPPLPEWDERTDVRNERAVLEREAILRAYVESTPPRPRLGSKHDR
jgi:hypothetical protein